MIERMSDRGTPIIEVRDVSKSFEGADGAELRVLDSISMTLRAGEIVALLGKSGSGKSTLLRTIAGLIPPTSGEVRYRGTPLQGVNPGVAMVFQSFALLPWLTVQQNVELGMQARGVPAAERAKTALDAIDLIGLDGFEQAYPRELSGGMRQRVGFARALALRPDALLMDEPFSALDVLTAENLRGELIALWGRDDFPTNAVCIVTHNIKEAVQVADRVLVLGSNPGRIVAETPIDLPRPRDESSAAFEAAVATLYEALAGRDERAPEDKRRSPVTNPLPDASVGGMAGLGEMLVAHGDGMELPDLAELLNFEADDLFPLVDAAAMLGLVRVEGAFVKLTSEGAQWVGADILASKELFAQAALRHAPLVGSIVRALASAPDGEMREAFFRDILRRAMSVDDAEKQLDIAIDWGRYGELFDYDADSAKLVRGDSVVLAQARPTSPGRG